MSVPRALHVEVRSDPRELCQVRDRLEAWTAANGWNEHQMHDIVLAVDEALTNVIKHGYRNEGDHRIIVDVRAVRDARLGGGVEIRIRDFGRQVPLDSICSRDLDDIRPGGLGVHIIHSVMNEVRYEHAEGGGMLLVMRRYRDHDPRGGEERP